MLYDVTRLTTQEVVSKTFVHINIIHAHYVIHVIILIIIIKVSLQQLDFIVS